MREDWIECKLSELSTFELGGDWGKSPEFSDDNYIEAFCIRGSEFRNWNNEKGKTASLRKLKKQSVEKRNLKENDILVEISGGGPEQPVGRTVVIDKSVLINFKNKNLVPTNFLRLMRPTNFTNSVYLNMFLKYFYTTGEIIRYQAGSNNLRNLKFKDYLTINIPLAPLPIQRAIVAKIESLFSDLDKGRADLKKAQAQLKVYRQAVLKKAFEGELTKEWRENQNNLPTADELLEQIKQERQKHYEQQLEKWELAVKTWEKNGNEEKKPGKPRKLTEIPLLNNDEICDLPSIPKTMLWTKLGEIVWSVKDGPHYSPKYTEKGIPFLSGGNIRPIGIDLKNVKYISAELHKELSKRCKPEINDILYTKGGTTGIARVNTSEIEFNVWVHVAVLKPIEMIIPFYLQYVLNSTHCYKQSQKFTHGVGNQDLGLTRMILITLPVCSNIEQKQIIKEIESRLSVCDKVEQSIIEALIKSDALRQSILKKAFEGNLLSEAEIEKCKQEKDYEPASVLLEKIRRK
jgi:type I restriction enzyme S subunit